MKLAIRTLGAPTKDPAKRKTKVRPTTKALLPAQRLFIERYVIHRNGSRAYRESHPGCAQSTAEAAASRMLADYRVLQEVKRATAEITARHRHSAAKTLDEVARLAFANVQDFLDEDGSVRPPQDIPRPVMAAVKKLEADEIYGPAGEDGERKVIGRKVRLELHDKVTPLRLMAQHYNLLVEQVQVSPGRDFASILEAAAQRVIDAARAELIEGPTPSG